MHSFLIIMEIWILLAGCRVFEFQFNLIFCSRHVRVPDFARFQSAQFNFSDAERFGICRGLGKEQHRNLKEHLLWSRSQHNDVCTGLILLWPFTTFAVTRGRVQKKRFLWTKTRYLHSASLPTMRGGGLGSSTIFKKFNEPYAPS